jgi:hypothetical protein
MPQPVAVGTDGMILANERYLLTANENTKIVPGHGALAIKANLREFVAMLIEAQPREAAVRSRQERAGGAGGRSACRAVLSFQNSSCSSGAPRPAATFWQTQVSCSIPATMVKNSRMPHRMIPLGRDVCFSIGQV